MDEDDREKIKKILADARGSLTERLQVTVDLLHNLRKLGVLKPWDVDDISRETNNSQKVDKLIEKLKLQPASGYDTFVEVMKTQHQEVYQVFEKLEVNHKYENGGDIKEKELRLLADKLGAEWESLATHLGFSRPQIDQFRTDGAKRGISNAMFDMLVSWQQQQSKGVDCRQLLRPALEKVGRRDLKESMLRAESGIDERELRLLADKLGAEWESLATHLGFSRSQIDRFRLDGIDRGIGNTMFDMLVSWQQRQPQVVNFRQLLGNALENVGRQDLAEFMSLGQLLEEADPVLHRCRQDLSSHYLDTLCKIPLYPGDKTECVELKDIYTKVSISINLPKPCRAISIPLSSLHDMFTRKGDDGRVNKRLLISAPAGFGKTTTTAKLANDWSDSETDTPLADFCLLFVINMRWVDHTSDLEDVIMAQLLPHDTKMTKEVLRRRLEELGDRVMIILDAVDESDRELFKHPENCGSVVKLLTGKILTSCRLVVTTRPWRMSEIVHACKSYTRLDISGFSKEDIKAYIRQFFKHDKTLGESLVKYMEQHAIIAEVCVVPLMCLLICIYWKETHEDAIPNRIGELYDAIFDIMYAHMQAKEAVYEVDRSQEESDLRLLVQELGKIALDGLWPPENRLVFSSDEVSDPATILKASKMGLIAREEGRSSRRRKRLAAKSSTESAPCNDAKLTFFHKSAQEKCAGEYLAHLVDADLKVFQSRLESLTTIEEALSIQHVLRFACGKNCEAAHRILQRLVEIFGNVPSLVDDFYTENLDLDDTLKLQQFLGLCLGCNYEANCKDRFHMLLRRLFPRGQIYFLGISSSTALALGYFMRHSDPDIIIKSLTLRPIAHPGDNIEPVGSILRQCQQNQRGVNQIPRNKLQEICQEYFGRCQGSVHSDNKILMQSSPAAILTFIQTWQACQHLPTAEETNVGPIIDALQHSQLEKLDINGFKMSGKMDKFVKVCDDGHMSHLLTLNVSNIGMVGHQSEQLARAIQHMPNLRRIDMSKNVDEDGHCLQHLTESLPKVNSLEVLAIEQMGSSSQSMRLFARRFPQFGSQLIVLRISGNDMDDIVAAHLESNLPQAKRLQHLWIGVAGLSRKHHNQLVLTMGHLRSLEILMIYHSENPDDLLVSAADVIKALPILRRLSLNAASSNRLLQVSSTSWQIFKAKLQKAVKLSTVNLYGIALERNDFKEFVAICRKKQFSSVSYDIICVPDDVSVPQDDMFEFE